ncbi:type III PLP-dependent enzyme [Bailinhaonella thermotolerans]|uniref:Type III PLP-dependent enzyme n=1 Tax=Bailinhaonella thermotolerans TaxID=1070861 RepID=A0A3A4AV69_9ACTN|nr:type III PLP-dependent enzyme [Bailinhaonella thermotolerans]RJL33505.1 type III PLP-dependent enzyme [Bailinhaonella thermotolerans]
MPDLVLPELGSLPAYVYDLGGLTAHTARIRSAVKGTELLYAAKANPDPNLLRAIAPHVDGFEVASGGELAHVRETVPGARIFFGGPGKTDAELAAALDLGVERVHVESPHELRRLAAVAGGRFADVLLRANLDVPVPGASLTMGGEATPFGMDPAGLSECLSVLHEAPWLRLRGVHVHLASGLAAPEMLALTESVLAWVRPWLRACALRPVELNLGGGMAVNYADPADRFDWVTYGEALAALREPEETFRVEPGRAVAAYYGWYVTRVLDVKVSHGETFAVLTGGTHHLRTPVTKGHDQPFSIVPAPGGPSPADRAPSPVPVLSGGPRLPGLPAPVPVAYDRPVTLVGQLCTPKDVFARRVRVERIAVDDLVVFSMAGAYAWNISHHDFLMHPKPEFHYLPA